MATMKFDPDNVMVSELPDGTFTPEMTGTLMKEVADNSLVMQLGEYVEMEGKQEKKFQFQTDGVSAYWVDEGQKIQTDKPEFAEATMRAKKLGIILLASREYLTYKWSDFFEVMKPQIAEAFYKKFDQAAILDEDNPFAFALDKAAVTAGNVLNAEISADSILDLEDLIYDNNGKVDGFISNHRNHSTLRKANEGVDEPIYDRNNRQIDGLTTVNYEDLPKGIIYTGDFSNLVYGVPYNITFKISEDATISTVKNEDGSDVNLYEQELIALRATMDIAFMTRKDEAFAKLDSTDVEAGE